MGRTRVLTERERVGRPLTEVLQEVLEALHLRLKTQRVVTEQQESQTISLDLALNMEVAVAVEVTTALAHSQKLWADPEVAMGVHLVQAIIDRETLGASIQEEEVAVAPQTLHSNQVVGELTA